MSIKASNVFKIIIFVDQIIEILEKNFQLCRDIQLETHFLAFLIGYIFVMPIKLY